MDLVFARIAWHPRYDGEYPTPYIGSKWREKGEEGFGEWQNFKTYKGSCYGYVKTTNMSIDLTNFGVDSNSEYADCVTVVWVATSPNGGSRIVGWYTDATVYPEYNERPSHLKFGYLFKAKASNCRIIKEDDRNFIITQIFRNLWYARGEADLKRNVLKYIKNCGENNDYFIDPVELDYFDTEGKKSLVTHVMTERSSSLVREFKKNISDFSCVVCGFNFKDEYGDIGDSFIEAHHINPVSSMKSNQNVSVKNLTSVCSNCHRMLHRKNPPYTVKQLKLMKKNSSK